MASSMALDKIKGEGINSPAYTKFIVTFTKHLILVIMRTIENTRRNKDAP